MKLTKAKTFDSERSTRENHSCCGSDQFSQGEESGHRASVRNDRDNVARLEEVTLRPARGARRLPDGYLTASRAEHGSAMVPNRCLPYRELPFSTAVLIDKFPERRLKTT